MRTLEVFGDGYWMSWWLRWHRHERVPMAGYQSGLWVHFGICALWIVRLLQLPELPMISLALSG